MARSMDHQTASPGADADPHDYSRRPGAGLLLAPANLLDLVIPWTRARLSGSFFTRASSALGWAGAQAVFLAGAAALVYLLLLAIRTDSLSLGALCLLVPPVTAVLQHAALTFARQGEGRVRSTPTAISSNAIFDLLGIALALLGALIIALAVVELVRDADREALEALVIQVGVGELVLITGALLLNPALINVHQDPSCTLGQDGLAIIGAVLKAVLAGARIAFGSIAAVGALAALYGCARTVFDADALEYHGIFMLGAFAVGAAALLPLYAYVASAVYFVLVDALDAIIRTGRRA